MPVEFKDYYKVLGVERTASSDDIRKAFRKLARLYHPDVAKDKKGAEEKFKAINEAYEVLGDAEKRKKYDDLGADWKDGGPRPGPGGQAYRTHSWRTGQPGGEDVEFNGTGFSDFFEQFFGGGGRSNGGAKPAAWFYCGTGNGKGTGCGGGPDGHAGRSIEGRNSSASHLRRNTVSSGMRTGTGAKGRQSLPPTCFGHRPGGQRPKTTR